MSRTKLWPSFAHKLCLFALITCPALTTAQEIFTLPEARAGTKFEFRIQTEAGVPPLRWRVLSGHLPPGIELLPSGMLRRTLTSSSSTPFKFLVADSSQPPRRLERQFSFPVAARKLRFMSMLGQRTRAQETAGFDPATFIHIYEDTKDAVSSVSPNPHSLLGSVSLDWG
jgi:hypothetical protein